MNSHHSNASIILPTPTHPVILYSSNGRVTNLKSLQGVAVFPGSFNPLHAGHKQLAAIAAQRLQRDVVFEISVSNVDKQSLDKEQLLWRLQQFPDHAVAVTNASKFLQKSELFAGCPFVVGFDTAARILQARFYNNDPVQLQDTLRSFRQRNHRFVVGGRLAGTSADSRFCCGDELAVPEGFRELFDVVPESEFRSDISSTVLRANNSHPTPDTDAQL